MDAKNELEVLFPEGNTVTIQQENITIKPFKLGQLPKVFRLIQPVSALIFAAMKDQSLVTIDTIMNIMGEGGDNIIELLAVACNKPREWADNLEMDESVDLFAALIEVNTDFFIHKVLPKVNQQMDRVVKKPTDSQ